MNGQAVLYGSIQYIRLHYYARHNLSSQLTPQPQPDPCDCGFSNTRKLLPISSVAKSTVEPFSKPIDTASTTMLLGLTVGCAKVLENTKNNFPRGNRDDLLIVCLTVVSQKHLILITVASTRLDRYPQCNIRVFLPLRYRPQLLLQYQTGAIEPVE